MLSNVKKDVIHNLKILINKLLFISVILEKVSIYIISIVRENLWKMLNLLNKTYYSKINLSKVINVTIKNY